MANHYYTSSYFSKKYEKGKKCPENRGFPEHSLTKPEPIVAD
jgi:hypothetical protein